MNILYLDYLFPTIPHIDYVFRCTKAFPEDNLIEATLPQVLEREG